MKLFGVLRDEARGVLREWFQRDEIPLGLYIVGTAFIAPIIPLAFALRVWHRMR